MSTVAEIKAAIDRLSLQERCELEALLHPFDDDEWDEQMKRDAAAGKFDAINAKPMPPTPPGKRFRQTTSWTNRDHPRTGNTRILTAVSRPAC